MPCCPERVQTPLHACVWGLGIFRKKSLDFHWVMHNFSHGSASAHIVHDFFQFGISMPGPAGQPLWRMGSISENMLKVWCHRFSAINWQSCRPHYLSAGHLLCCRISTQGNNLFPEKFQQRCFQMPSRHASWYSKLFLTSCLRRCLQIFLGLKSRCAQKLHSW